MPTIDRHTARGILSYTVRRRGEVLEVVTGENLIVTGGRAADAHLLAGDGAGKTVTRIGFGTNGATPLPGDTALTAAYVKDLDGHSYPAAGQVSFAFSLTDQEANGIAIVEFGLFCADGTLYAHKVRSGGPIAKDSDITISDATWTIIF